MSFVYLANRLWQALIVLLGVALIVFALVHLTGDPVSALVPPFTPAEQREQIRRQLGLDRALPVQFADFIWRAMHGDFGQSWRHNRAAMELVAERLPATVQLAGASLALAVLLGGLAGTVAAARWNTPFDAVAQVGALLGQAMPAFWLGLVFILLFAVKLGWLPPSGSGSWQHLVLPAVTASLYPAAMIMRLTRASLLEVLAQDYIRTAYAKGLGRQAVITGHALKNAAIPVVTFLGLQLSFLMGGLVVVESVFAYPGMGLLTVQAIATRDLPVIQSFVVLMAVIVVAVNLLLDVVYVLLDPRISY